MDTLPMDVRDATDAAAVARIAEALYGAPVGAAEGVLHVVAVTPVDDRLHVLLIGPDAPKSDTDFFALNLARARVSGIVVSGAVLRAEPELRYDLLGPGRAAEGLAAWRREVAGLAAPPWLLVLTRSGDLPADHPVWSSGARPLVYTGPEAASRLRAALPDRVEVVEDEAPSPRRAIRHLREARGCAGVSIEAGPAVAAGLYAPPVAVDELMLSVFEGAVDPRAVGPALLDARDLRARLVETAAATRVVEPSGPWRFSRWRRRAG